MGLLPGNQILAAQLLFGNTQTGRSSSENKGYLGGRVHGYIEGNDKETRITNPMKKDTALVTT